MGTVAPALVSVEEYLHTTYHPDCDYIDGELEERNVGQQDHSFLQGRFLVWFYLRRGSLNLEAYVEWRTRVASDQYRIPDVCVVKLPVRREPILTEAPYIVIEILSPEDTLSRMRERLGDFLNMGVPNIWVIDGESTEAWVFSAAGLLRVPDGILRTADGLVVVPIAEVIDF